MGLAKIRAAISITSGQRDLYAERAIEIIKPLADQADIMNRIYDVVVANPPYMGGNGMTKSLKEYAKGSYPFSKSDTFAMFIERGFEWISANGYNAMVTMQSWMFLSGYQDLRESLLNNKSIACMAHMDNGVMGIAFGTAATVFRNSQIDGYRGQYSYTTLKDIGANNRPITFPVKNNRLQSAPQSEFEKIPGMTIAYWAPQPIIKAFEKCAPLSNYAETRIGLITGDNNRYIRYWHEVPFGHIGLNQSRESAKKSQAKWFPQSKGGLFRKWYGNNETIVDWSNDGHELQMRLHESGKRVLAHNFNLDKIFLSAITWTKISSGSFAARLQPRGFLFNDASCNAYAKKSEYELPLLGLLCSNICMPILELLNPTLNFLPGNVSDVPVKDELLSHAEFIGNVSGLVELHRKDWNSFETSWDFEIVPWIKYKESIQASWSEWRNEVNANVLRAKALERRNNEILISAYECEGHISPEISDKEISLYKIVPSEAAHVPRPDIERLISYAVGCMMGRYSIDRPGIVYANFGNLGFDPTKYAIFPADADGIIPLTDESWFKDDATERFAEFVSKVWPAEGIEANLVFVANALDAKANELPRDVIRRYFADDFFRDHCQTYKKRPIYWLFSSGKQRAFQCLVYLHRYNADTLGRMRADYVIPLQGKLQGRLATLTEEVTRAGSTAQRKQAQKALDLIDKKMRELAAFDDQLRSYADKRIELDLDDGVKVNIRKFGTLIDLKPLGNLDTEE